MKKIAILDYGLGNLRSVQKGLEYAGAEAIITKDPEQIDKARGIILPGVGAFGDGMKNLKPLESLITEAVRDGKPLLGICLGMQMLLDESEEGGRYRGLGLIPGRVVRFPHSDLKVPHMGWNSISIKKENPSFAGIKEGSFMYFVHSYYAETADKNVVASCNYGIDFPAVIADETGIVTGTQFHPEKSGDVGLRILKKFVENC